MLVSFLIRLAFIYFLWTIGRKLWRAYQLTKRMQTPSSTPRKPTSKNSGQTVEAEFRVLREQD